MISIHKIKGFVGFLLKEGREYLLGDMSQKFFKTVHI
jgi:hypothetical protein